MGKLILPGLVDVHTHLRVPGGEHKEDFSSGTAAALAGGVTTVLAMPNTTPPLTEPAALLKAVASARSNIHCDVGLFAGASFEQLNRLPEMATGTVGLKIYLNDTFGPLRVDSLPTLQSCFEVWPTDKPIAMHAEGQSVAVGVGLAAAYDRSLHFCHISRADEIRLIAQAKMRGLSVTCEVAPHHLFLDERDAERLGPFGDMRPKLARTEDVEALWEHINDTIDCIATDHAPHTIEEKNGANPPPGVPGLETSLGLMLSAVEQGKLTVDRLIELMSTNPRRIFNLPEQADTHVEVDLIPTAIRSSETVSKCGWTPFDGMMAGGTVRRVVLRGKTVYADGQVLADPGSGHLISG